jgi:hypothetical protein
MMRLFKTPSFQKDLANSDLTDADLRAAVVEIERGLIDAHLGGELVKKRVARPASGKRGGYRTILAYRRGDRLVFMHLFAKNEKATTDKKELAALKALAKYYMALTHPELDTAVIKQALKEIEHVTNT